MEGDLAGSGWAQAAQRQQLPPPPARPRAGAPVCALRPAGLEGGSEGSHGRGGGESPLTGAARGSRRLRGSRGRRAPLCSSGKTSVQGCPSFSLPLKSRGSLSEAGVGVGGAPLRRISLEQPWRQLYASTKGTGCKYP